MRWRVAGPARQKLLPRRTRVVSCFCTGLILAQYSRHPPSSLAPLSQRPLPRFFLSIYIYSSLSLSPSAILPTMALSLHAITQIRRYSSHLPRDPHYRLKATLATGYVVSALTLPFVPPLLETRRAKADGSDRTRCVRILLCHVLCGAGTRQAQSKYRAMC